MHAREQDSISLEANDDAEDDANGNSTVPPVLKLKAVVVGKERYLFGKDSMVLEEAVVLDNKEDDVDKTFFLFQQFINPACLSTRKLPR